MESHPWQDEATLRRLFEDEYAKPKEAANELGCSVWTIRKWTDRHGVNRKAWRDESLIRELYHGQRMTVEEVADHVNRSRSAIIDRMNECGIERRGSGEYQTPEELTDPEWLRAKNHEEGLRAGEIAEHLNVSESAVYSAFNRLGVENEYSRDPSQGAKEALRDAERLERFYIEDGLSTVKIADELGVNQSTVYYWLDKHGIETRSQSDITGELHPRFNPDADYHVYNQEWAEVREEVIQSDNECCQNCGMTREECKDEYGMDLDVHHIIPQREVEDRYDTDNMTTLCRSCHATEEQSNG